MKIPKDLILILFFYNLIICSRIDPNEPELADYEIEHIKTLRKNAAECTLFLKRNDEFPILNPGKVLLVGSGARNTVKGGGGSGNVESRYYTTCEEGLEDAGFTIVSKDFFEKYDEIKASSHVEFVNYVKKLSKNYNSYIRYFVMGICEPQPEYDISLEEYSADIAIYVVGRYSGEGNDRNIQKGDFYLSDSEVKDILYLNEKYKKFMLVLNTVGIVDLSPVKDVSNILVLSSLGVVTGDILADIVLGKANPSGKLSDTWASAKDYRFLEEFGSIDNTRYIEGVYVGYRYFDSANVKPLYPFGFGKSYTDFSIEKVLVSNKKDIITIKVIVENIGNFNGKEVVQVYVSPSQENKSKPYQTLVDFKKTKELIPNEKQPLDLVFKLRDVARYDENQASYILDKGNYIIRVGNSSDKTKVFCVINLEENIITEKLKNVGGKADFGELEFPIEYKDDLNAIQIISLAKSDFSTKEANYNYKPNYSDFVKSLNIETAAKMCLSESITEVSELVHKLLLGDGPAGIRVARKYGVDEKGTYRLCDDPMDEGLRDYLSPEELATLDNYDNNKDRKGEIFYQFATAIPIGIALGQSFNEDLVEIFSDMIGNEMEIFNINLLLAPGVNIHRNPLCGRSYEYYSEDPLLSGKLAGAYIRGVQSHKNKGATIKHFICNEQEFDRYSSNSILSERALREIYLKPFQIAIESSEPFALMTSYNLVNGVHTSERSDLIKDVLRCEWGFDGLIMSDFYMSGIAGTGISNQPPQTSVNNIMNGNNYQLVFGGFNYFNVLEALGSGTITKEHIYECASKVYEAIEKLNN